MKKKDVLKFLKNYKITLKMVAKHSGYTSTHLSRFLHAESPLTVAQTNCLISGIQKSIEEKRGSIDRMWEDYKNL